MIVKLLMKALQTMIVVLCASIGFYTFLAAWKRGHPESLFSGGPVFVIGLIATLCACLAFGLVISVWINRRDPPSKSQGGGET